MVIIVKTTVETEAKEYNELKLRYYKLLESGGSHSKGDIRAFVGVHTWLKERELLGSGADSYGAHVQGLNWALSELENAMQRGEVKKQLFSAKDSWEDTVEEEFSLPKESADEPLLPPPIPDISTWEGDGFSLVSLFSGALGLDLGFLASGFDLKYANDIEEDARGTVQANLPDVSFGYGDFDEIGTEEVLREAGLEKGEVDVLTGGPPCQPFSTAGKREGLNDPRSSPLKGFIKAIKEIRPKAFVMEEVTGLKSARLKHVPIDERDRELEPEEKKGSVFEVILDMFESTGYEFTYNTLNAADYGSPQKRNRLVFIGLREGQPNMPDKSHSSNPEQKLLGEDISPWRTFWEATVDIQSGAMTSASLSGREEYMRLVPPAGYWKHLPEDRVEEAMGGAYNSGGGRMGYYRRLSWDEPTPTVVTSPNQKSTMLCHPEALRPLSLEEYKRIQGFPDDWEIKGSLSSQYKLVGNAVPVHLSYSIAKYIKKALKG